MYLENKPTFVSLLFVISLLLGGCTTYVGNITKDESYNKKITNTSVVWQPPVMLRTKISRSAQGYKPQVTPEDREKSQKVISDLLGLFSTHSVDMVSGLLAENSVSIVPGGDAANTIMTITATNAETKCVPLGCNSSLWIYVKIFDFEERKDVWLGHFKVGAPLLAENDPAVIQNFAESLVEQLKGSGLI